MKNKISRHISIARHIVDGSLTIDSVKEFRSILRIFPNDPALHRVYADLLARKKSVSAAMASYRKSAALFIESEMMLQATTVHPLTKGQKKPDKSKTFLTANDFFGDIYPFDSAKLSQSYYRLRSTCRSFQASRPNIQLFSMATPGMYPSAVCALS